MTKFVYRGAKNFLTLCMMKSLYINTLLTKANHEQQF